MKRGRWTTGKVETKENLSTQEKRKKHFQRKAIRNKSQYHNPMAITDNKHSVYSSTTTILNQTPSYVFNGHVTSNLQNSTPILQESSFKLQIPLRKICIFKTPFWPAWQKIFDAMGKQETMKHQYSFMETEDEKTIGY